MIGGEVEELLDTLKSPYQPDMTGNERLRGSTSFQDELHLLKEQILQILSEADRDLTLNEISQEIEGYDEEEVREELVRLRDEEEVGVINPGTNEKHWRLV